MVLQNSNQILSNCIQFLNNCGLIAKPHTRCQLLITLDNNFGFIDFTKEKSCCEIIIDGDATENWIHNNKYFCSDLVCIPGDTFISIGQGKYRGNYFCINKLQLLPEIILELLCYAMLASLLSLSACLSVWVMKIIRVPVPAQTVATTLILMVMQL